MIFFRGAPTVSRVKTNNIQRSFAFFAKLLAILEFLCEAANEPDKASKTTPELSCFSKAPSDLRISFAGAAFCDGKLKNS